RLLCYRCAMMACLVKQPGAAVAEQPRLLELHARLCDPALHGIKLNDGSAERVAFRGAHHHQLDQELAEADRTHAVVDARRPQSDLRDLKTLTFGAEQVFARHAHSIECQLADWRDMILA